MMKQRFTISLLAILLASGLCGDHWGVEAQTKAKGNQNSRGGGGGGTGGGDYGGFFGPGGGFTIPGGWGGGYGGAYGGPNGGYFGGGTVRPSVVCKEIGPCYKMKLTCPARCFYSDSRSGKNYGAGGGGGSCTMDCKKSCRAYC